MHTALPIRYDYEPSQGINKGICRDRETRLLGKAGFFPQWGNNMTEYSDYQKDVIRRYYDNREQIDFQRLSELVTTLYLAEGKKRARLWESARETMLRLSVPQSRVEHVVRTDDPAILAEVVNDLQAGRI